MRKVKVCINLDYQNNLDLLKDLNTQPVTELIESYKTNGKNYDVRMPQ